MYHSGAASFRHNAPSRRFDEYYRVYPIAMMAGAERSSDVSHGGKIFLPASALDQLTRLHISYPMLFELINGRAQKRTHAGVLEFTAEEGKIYLPYWLMQTLTLEPGDLLQVKSTDLPPGTFIKLQPQSPAFLDISDPKAVLENAFRNFSCLTTGDIFSFEYCDSVYQIGVLEVKPDMTHHAICTMETDLEVDFAAPVGYVEPTRETQKGLQTNKSKGGKLGTFSQQGTMAQRINYDAIKPQGNAAAVGAAAASSNFATTAGNRLGSSRNSAKSSGTSTPAAANAAAVSVPMPAVRRGNGPQPLRLPPGQLFFGWDVVPLKKDGEKGEKKEKVQRFTGMGQTLRGKKVEAQKDEEDDGDVEMGGASDPVDVKGKGRTLRDTPKS
jgi:ubiquitin fusion degradation protein 1